MRDCSKEGTEGRARDEFGCGIDFVRRDANVLDVRVILVIGASSSSDSCRSGGGGVDSKFSLDVKRDKGIMLSAFALAAAWAVASLSLSIETSTLASGPRVKTVAIENY